jgi:uncharacterized iron-regulated protein
MGMLFQGVLVVLWVCQALSQDLGIFDGNTGDTVNVQQMVANVKPGGIVVIGEKHGVAAAQRQQLQILQALRERGLKVSVGMEFLTYPDQAKLDSYRKNEMDEETFLKAVNWGSPSYEFYKGQILFPDLAKQEQTIALNAPRFLTGKIAKQGLASLLEEERKLFPPDFELGRDSYKQRFAEVMPHIPNPEKLDNYFAAQSLWDETMAWTATNFIKANPDHVLVIIVGEFHVEYGGGLPDRLKKRGAQQILTITQLDAEDYSEEELIEAIVPSHRFGSRSDFVWVF